MWRTSQLGLAWRTTRRRRQRQRPTAHCCLTPARLGRAPARSPASSPSRMPHPSCDRLTHRPPSPPHLHWRAANPPRVPPTQPGRSAGSRDSSRGRGKGATSFQCFVAAHSQHRAPRMKDEGSSSRSPRCREGRGHWCQQRGLLWEGDMGLIEPQVCPMHSQPAPSPQKSKVSGASSLLLSASSWTEHSTLISSYLKVVLSLTEGTGRLAGFFSESLSRGEHVPCPGRGSP